MKLTGLVLLSGYFLARERETAWQTREPLRLLLADWTVYAACLAAAIFGGWLSADETVFRPGIILLAGISPAIFLRGRPLSALSGSAAAFWILRFSEFSSILAAAAIISGTVFLTAFFYTGTRLRMLRLAVPEPVRKKTGGLLLLLALAALDGWLCQKIIQLF